MEKLNGETLNIVNENIEKLKQLFPEAFREGKIDFETLKAELGESVENAEERYSFNWNGKAAARRIAQTPSTGTLRPCPSESVNWDTTQNLFLEGDNLEVLKLLQKSYHSKVKMIYIDPPYNTGKEFIYPDNFYDNLDTYLQYTGQKDAEGRKFGTNAETSGRYHTNWLNMMYPRLKLARNLLRDDGVIFISIDDNEVHNLRKICDEIFGEGNFVGNIVLQTATDNNPSLVNTEHEYILVFSKNKEYQDTWQRKSEAAELIIDQYQQLKKKHENDIGTIQAELRKWINKNKEKLPKVTHYDNVDYKGVFHDADVANTKFGGYIYDVIHPKTNLPCKIPEKGYRFPESTMNELILNDDILFGDDEKTLIKPKKRIENVKDALRSVIYEDGRSSTKVVESLIGRAVFDNPKSHFILSRLIDFVTNDTDAILDFFAGSGSTAHAILKLNSETNSNRKFICVQLPECLDDTEKKKKEKKEAIAFCHSLNAPKTIAEISKERIRRAAKKIAEENPEYKGDLGFKVFKLDSSNIKTWDANFANVEQSLLDAVDNIKQGRTSEDLLYEILLKYGLDLTLPIETRDVGGKRAYILGYGALIICLDDDVTLDTVSAIAALKQEFNSEITRVVFKDGGFANDVVKTNAIQMLKQHGIDDVKSV